MAEALVRDALYYPYIHIRDVNWLKATLLCFPHVRRMVPQDFGLNDSEEVQAFLDAKGTLERPLLFSEPTETQPVILAEHRLIVKFAESQEFLQQRYTQAETEKEYGSKAVFQIHRGKMYELLHFLEDKGLAWHDWEIRGDTAGQWFVVHPDLGEAIVSALAIAIAEDQGLDIVTSSGRVHRALATLDEDALLVNLLGKGAKPAKLYPEEKNIQMVDELAEVVMTTSFDVSKLSAQDIATLTREGHSLQNFKNALLPIVSAIPDIHDPEECQARLKEAAGEVIASWEKYQKSLPKFAMDAIISGMGIKPPELVMTAVGAAGAGAGAGAASTLLFGGAVGLAVGLIIYSGVNVFKAYKEKAASPFNYLTRVEKAGATLTMPPATKR